MKTINCSSSETDDLWCARRTLRTFQASKEQLENWELPGDGEGIHWPDVDEDLSVAGLLTGTH